MWHLELTRVFETILEMKHTPRSMHVSTRLCRSSAWILLFACPLSLSLWTPPARAEDESEVIVNGSQINRTASRDATAASTVLRRKDLDSPGATAATVLVRVPGVQVQRSGGGSDLATASLRGTTSTQTPVYLAGIRLNDDLSGTADLSTVPLWMLDRIEVYRGHTPPNADSLGIGGAVFFEPRYPKGPEVRAGVTAGSWDSRSVYGSVGQGTAQSSSMFALRRESASNNYRYLDNGGTAFATADDQWVTRRNADQVTTDAWAISRTTLANSGQVVLISNAFDREQGITGLAAVPVEHVRAHITRELLGTSSRVAINCSSRRPCQLASATSFHRASVQINDPAYELGLGAAALSATSNRIAQRLDFTWPLANQFSITAQALAQAETLEVARPGLLSLDAMRHQGMLGSNFEWKVLQALTLLGAARLETETTQAAQQETASTYPVGRLGAAFEILDGWSFLSNWGSYSRPPTLGELYGTSASVMGNSALVAEKGFNRDVGTRFRYQGKRAAVALEAYAFRQDIDKLVGWQHSSFGRIRPYNVGKARLEGLETSVGIELFPNLRVESGVTFLDPRDVTAARTLKNDIIPFRSRLVADAGLEVHTSHLPASLGLSRAAVSFRGTHRGSRYQDAAGLIIIPHSTTFDLGICVLLRQLPLSIRASVYNLFDQPSFDVVGYPLPPRSVMLGAEFDWEQHP
jgi:vitamin B12 transporter